jgi:polysaccharide export outer membrane protein
MRFNLVSVTLIFCLLSIYSCRSRKDVVYFQPPVDSVVNGAPETNLSYVARIQTGDILSVFVRSMSSEASEIFNPYQGAVTTTTQLSNNNTAPPPAIGYLVDQDGNIVVPLLGKVNLKGLTTSAAQDLIAERLNEKYLKEPTVNVRILNFKVTILGEVARPSVYTIPNEKISLPEAIGLAGDLNIYGRRDNIQVIRVVDGKKVFARVDLTSRKIFNSPYFYLEPNDIIYVEPTNGKVGSSDRAQQLLPVLISGLSLLTVIFTNIFR